MWSAISKRIKLALWINVLSKGIGILLKKNTGVFYCVLNLNIDKYFLLFPGHTLSFLIMPCCLLLAFLAQLKQLLFFAGTTDMSYLIVDMIYCFQYLFLYSYNTFFFLCAVLSLPHIAHGHHCTDTSDVVTTF